MFNPKYTISNKILQNISRIEAAKEVIENAPFLPAWEAKFRDEALVRTVHFGTHVEGNPLDLGEVKEVLEGRPIIARDRDIQEILNYRQVIKYLDKISERKEPFLSEEDFKKLHFLSMEKILSGDKCGSYRQGQAVLRNSRTGAVSFIPPAVSEVTDLTKNFFDWINSLVASECHPVILAGITHFELARIHPFADGNGRTARAMATLVLLKRGYDIKRFFSLEEYYDRNAKGYYQALQSVVPPDYDLTFWLEYFTLGLTEELKEVKEKIQRLSVDLKLKGKVGQVVLSERQIKLLEYLQNYGKITNPEWRRLLPDISDDTILRELRDLMKKRLIAKKGKTKAAFYTLR